MQIVISIVFPDRKEAVQFGQTFNGPMLGHGHEYPKLYDLHVWLGRTNPAGIFADFNPTVGCPE